MTPAPTLLLTRPLEQSQAFAQSAGFEVFGDRIVISPLLRIEHLPVQAPPQTADLVFTSANAVEAAVACHDLTGRRAYAVGDKTAQQARAFGLDCVSASGTVEALLELILSDPPKGPILHLSGEVTRGNLVERLTQAGVTATRRVVYRQLALPLSDRARAALAGPGPVIAPLFSPRTAQLLRDARLPPHASLQIVAMSAAIANVWNGIAPVMVVPAPTAVEMCRAVLRAASGSDGCGQ